MLFGAPELEGIVCEVQHASRTEHDIKPPSHDPGTCGVGVVVLPNGQPRIVLQMKHADGTSLGCILNNPQIATLLECLLSAGEKANRIAASVILQGSRPS